MATRSSDSTVAVPQASPSSPLATEEHRICFVCLQNEKEIPNAEWVNPCPCTLDAHAACMLRWIAEVEDAGERFKNGLRCPACKAPITLEEPYDPVVGIRDRLYARYSRLSPYVLLTVVSGGGIVGAAWYGCNAAILFAGPEAVTSWLGPWGPWTRQARPSQVLRLWMLSSVGPGLVLMRWMPSLGSVLLLPFSVLHGATMVAHSNFPSWPPSPQWAMALLPTLHLGYAYLLYGLFGPLERRLNSALRGQFAGEELVVPEAGTEAALAAFQPVRQAAAPRYDGQRPGVWTFFTNLTETAVHAVMDLFFGEEEEEQPGIEVEYRVRVYGDDGRIIAGADAFSDSDSDDDDSLPQLEEDGAEQAAAEEHQAPEEQPTAEEQPADPYNPIEETPPEGDQAGQADQPHQHQPDDNNNGDNDNDDGNENDNDDGNGNGNDDNAPAGVSTLTRILNSLATSLLFPGICFGMGELIRAMAPKAWVARRHPAAGLLQEQWGRSLVGGCLFVVLRDAFALYAKYRRVQVRARRRIKNVERPPKVERGVRERKGRS